MSSAIKPDQAAVRAYYAALENYARLGAKHEGATETAFSQLLHATGKAHKWDLIPKQPHKVGGGKSVIPDGTLRDEFNLPRGYWEAKDTADDLDAEIQKKIAKKYPLINTIFEDTRRAVLYQNGTFHAEYDLAKPQLLADLLNRFFAFTEPNIEGFEEAVGEFKERVPELAKGLNDKIKAAHGENRKFQRAFAEFFDLCKTALNPNIRKEAVDEMLIQHLLTERLFRKIFHDDEFTRRNVIAAEVEKVIAALVSKSFSRQEFLKSLDKFYKAIELAAETIDDFKDKQHFLNTVYERFFQGYSVKTADTHGIVYTPQPIVDFMCASVEEVLKKEFGLTLGSKDVNILDPCTGTGNFVVNLLRRIPKKDISRVYKEQLFANEVMLLPYYIAALNIEHAYAEITGEYEAFDGLCFVDTLELAEEKPHLFSGLDERNTERVERQKKAPITVIIGNPPYNVGQINENDNNKNRAYPAIDDRIKKTYAKDSQASSVSKLNDPYVKFIRWATDRLGKDGIVCLVTNNSFVDKLAFDGMRKHLLRDYSCIYHLHLEGNVRHNPKLAGTTYNVFGIQVGVGITIAIKSSSYSRHRLFFHRIDKLLRKEYKLSWLTEKIALSGVRWSRLVPDDRHTWLVPENAGEFDNYLPIGAKEAKSVASLFPETIFKMFGLGVASHRDSIVYDFDKTRLEERIPIYVESYNGEVDRLKRQRGNVNIDDFVRNNNVVWSETLKANLKRHRYTEYDAEKIRTALYRPYCSQYLYFDDVLIDRRYQFPYFYPSLASEKHNIVIVLSDNGFRASTFSALVSRQAVDLHLCASLDGHQCFPFYVYDEDGTNRRDNITDWSLKQFQSHYKSKKLTKWDIFHYVYGLLHHPGYRAKFADNLKRELPRIPFAPDFQAFSKAGRKLADLHLNYDEIEPYKLKFIETDGVPLSYAVEKMKLSKDKKALKVNDSLTLAGIPPQVFEYRLGNRSALDWVIDQYRVTEDARSGIRSDPNREDDPEYIVRLVGQVVKVSLETVKIVNGLPKDYA